MLSNGCQLKTLKLGKSRDTEIKLRGEFGCNHAYSFGTLASSGVPDVFSGNESGDIVGLSHCRNGDTWEPLLKCGIFLWLRHYLTVWSFNSANTSGTRKLAIPFS